MNLIWFTYGRKYAGKGIISKHRGINSKTVDTAHKTNGPRRGTGSVQAWIGSQVNRTGLGVYKK